MSFLNTVISVAIYSTLRGIREPRRPCILELYVQCSIIYSLNSARSESPNRLIASVMFSSLAAANVARKNILSSLRPAALNQLPRETRTPLLTAAPKIVSSIASRVLPDVISGCFFQSTSTQCCEIRLVIAIPACCQK